MQEIGPGQSTTKVILTGWKPGFKKVALTKLIRDMTDLDLAAAKAHVDRLLAGETVEIELESEFSLAFITRAEAIGVIVQPPEWRRAPLFGLLFGALLVVELMIFMRRWQAPPVSLFVLIPAYAAFAAAVAQYGPRTLRAYFGRYGDATFGRRLMTGLGLCAAFLVVVMVICWTHQLAGVYRWQAVPVFAMPVVLGFCLVAASVRVKRSRKGFCASCGYDRRTDSPCCSECGNNWSNPGGTVKVYRKTYWPGAVVGWIVCVGPYIWGIAYIGVFDLLATISVAVPTESLIDDAISACPFSHDAKEAIWILNQRRLTVDQERRLGQGILDQRLVWGDLFRLDRWLESRAMTGKLPADLRERYFAEMVDLDIFVSEETRLADPIPVQLICDVRYAESCGSKLRIWCYIGGVSVDGGKMFVGRHDKRTNVEVLAACSSEQRRPISGAPAACTVRVMPPHEGVCELHYRVWVAVGPRNQATGDVIEWGPTGAPSFPAGILWSRQFDLTTTTRVVP